MLVEPKSRSDGHRTYSVLKTCTGQRVNGGVPLSFFSSSVESPFLQQRRRRQATGDRRQATGDRKSAFTCLCHLAQIRIGRSDQESTRVALVRSDVNCSWAFASYSILFSRWHNGLLGWNDCGNWQEKSVLLIERERTASACDLYNTRAISCNCPSLLNSRATDRSCSVSGAHKAPSRVILRSSYKCLAIASPFLGTDQLESTVHRSDNNKRRSTVHQVKAHWKPNQRGKIVLYFTTWWALNVVSNIYNKVVLNIFPFPWLTATLALAAGSIIMLCSWCMNFVKPPKVDSEFWLALLPVAIAHSVGHVAATVSMSKVAVSFTHVMKSSEPAFSVLVSTFMLGETFPTPVYLSLVPIIAGCSLAAATELNFDLAGFLGAIISNLAFVFRNIFSKRGMKGRSISGINYYACLSILSLLILTPFALLLEGPKLWAVGWQRALLLIGPDFLWWVVAQSVFYHLYNQFSHMSLDEISALTFSIGNTMKCISVIVSSIIIFRTPVRPLNIIGSAIAIIGAYIYSQAGTDLVYISQVKLV